MRSLFAIINSFLGVFNVRLMLNSNYQRIVPYVIRNNELSESFECRQRIQHLGSLLRPSRVKGFAKARVGGANDGAYVYIDDFSRGKTALSFGISDNVDWDLEMAGRGYDVYQFDHTVEKAPVSHVKAHFFKKKIVASIQNNNCEASLSSILREHAGESETFLVLKMDIEGDEWKVLEAASIEELGRFSQIACEFHDFDRIDNNEWFERASGVLKKLHEGFATIHVHGNNTMNLRLIGNVPFPQVLEATFANRSVYEFAACEEIFPTPLDTPNIGRRPDLYLGPFIFQG